MPSFDVVSKLDFQEVDNAIANSMKEINQRYDFKGSNSKLERNEKIITLTTEDELKAKQVLDILNGHTIKRNLDPRSISLKSSEAASGNTVRQTYNLIEGIEQDISKKIISSVKNSKQKVQVKIQGNELRVSGAKRDALQETIQLIKDLNISIPLQFINFRE
jgi:cyclic-di-GMP-binding protein